jgi:nitrate reductase NapE component
MNPYTNPPSPEPTRMEIQYRLTSEQEQMQRQVLKRVQGMRWLFRVFMIFFLLALVAVVGGIAFVIVQIAATFPH